MRCHPPAVIIYAARLPGGIPDKERTRGDCAPQKNHYPLISLSPRRLCRNVIAKERSD